jgi:hypothetical protein
LLAPRKYFRSGSAGGQIRHDQHEPVATYYATLGRMCGDDDRFRENIGADNDAIVENLSAAMELFEADLPGNGGNA